MNPQQTCLVAALAAITPLAAQSGPRDPLAAIGQAIVIAGDVNVLEKGVGDKTSRPQPFAAASNAPDSPNFSVQSLFGEHAPNIQIDAMSTGNDLLPIQVGGPTGSETYTIVQQPGLLSWASLMMSFDNGGGVGADPNSVLGQRAAATSGGVGADLFNYWFLGNAVLPPDLNDDAYFVAGREHMQLMPGEDIIALDGYMPVVADSNGEPDGLAQCVNRWFFSITPSSAIWIRQNWFAEELDDVFFAERSEISAAAVFEAVWDFSNDKWLMPTVRFPAEQMGLDPESDDIDALGFYQFQSVEEGDEMILFSVPLAASTDQVLVGQFGRHSPLLINDGQATRPVTPVGGPNPRNVDAICGFDPENVFSRWFGLPWRDAMFMPAPFGRIGLSGQRYLRPGGGVFLRVEANGLPAEAGTLTWNFSAGGLTRSRSVFVPAAADTASAEIPLLLATNTMPLLIWCDFQSASGGGRTFTLRLDL